MTVHGSDLWFSLTTSASQANQLLVAGTGVGGALRTYQSPCFAGLGGSIEASSADVLWAMCPTGMMAEAFRSTDGGSQWKALSAGELENSALLAPASDTTAVIQPAEQGELLRTDDGGATWQPVACRRRQRLVVVVDRFHRRRHRVGAGPERRPGQLALAQRPVPGAALAHRRRRRHLVRAGDDRRLTTPGTGGSGRPRSLPKHMFGW